MSFPKLTVTHAELRDATKDGPITIRIVGEPIPMKYPKKGEPTHFVNFQFGGKAYQYAIPNDAVRAEMEKHKGAMVAISGCTDCNGPAVVIESIAEPAAKMPTAVQKPSGKREDGPLAHLPPLKVGETPDDECPVCGGQSCQCGPEPEPEPPAAPRIGKLRSILYGRTLKVRDYENFRLELQIELSDADDAKAAYKALVDAVDGKADAILVRLQKQKH